MKKWIAQLTCVKEVLPTLSITHQKVLVLGTAFISAELQQG